MLKDTNSFDVLAPSSPHSQNQQQNAGKVFYLLSDNNVNIML
jgi:hypothetical protein